ncbi:MAG TPA: helix-hairpin-helix domain-containing protein [Chloroflexota bacterium]|nr:helix-hairpin-helix domain-containing protein [Chloroflexota bacterium]
MHEAADAIALEGTVERVTFYNPENGFSVVKLRVRGRREPVPVVGTLPAAQPGETLVLSGTWHIDPRHGTQFQPQQAELRRPSDSDGIIRYLGSGLIRQIGPVLAERIVAVFGEATLEVLDSAPERVREVPGIGRQRAQTISAAWIEHRALRSIVAFLAEHQLDTRFAPRLLETFGPDAPKILAANPYRLVSEVRGLGFEAADRLGRAIGVRVASPARLQAAVHAAFIRAAEHGHTRQRHDQAVDAAATAAGVPPELVEPAITQLMARGVLAASGAVPGTAPVDATGHGGTPAGALPLFVAPAAGARPARNRWPATPGCGSTRRQHRRWPARTVRDPVWRRWCAPRRIWRRACSCLAADRALMRGRSIDGWPRTRRRALSPLNNAMPCSSPPAAAVLC